MISSVSIPRIFGSVCTASLKSTLQTLLPKSLSLPLMCGECCLSAQLSLALSPPLLSFSSLSRSYCSPPDTKPSLIHLSSPMSPRPNHLRSHFIFYFSLFFFPLSLCSAPFVFLSSCSVSVLVFVLPPQTLSAFTHMQTYNTIAHAHAVECTYLRQS